MDHPMGHPIIDIPWEVPWDVSWDDLHEAKKCRSYDHTIQHTQRPLVLILIFKLTERYYSSYDSPKLYFAYCYVIPSVPMLYIYYLDQTGTGITLGLDRFFLSTSTRTYEN